MIRAGRIFLIIMAMASTVLAQDGATIFKQRCAACHKMDKKFVGPALQNIHLRRDSTWLVNFIRSSQTMIKAGDTAAINVYNQFHKVVMPDQKLNDAEMSALLAYFKTAGGAEPTTSGEKKVQRESTPVQIAVKDEVQISPEQRSRNLVIFFNRGAVFSLLGIAILFAILNFILLQKFR